MFRKIVRDNPVLVFYLGSHAFFILFVFLGSWWKWQFGGGMCDVDGAFHIESCGLEEYLFEAMFYLFVLLGMLQVVFVPAALGAFVLEGLVFWKFGERFGEKRWVRYLVGGGSYVLIVGVLFWVESYLG